MPLNTENKINRAFKLYDETVWLIGFGLLFLTYKAVITEKPLEQKLYNNVGLVFVWVIVLLKVWIIEIKDARTIIFRGLLRKNELDPKKISEYQEWVRGARVVYKDGSILLFCPRRKWTIEPVGLHGIRIPRNYQFLDVPAAS